MKLDLKGEKHTLDNDSLSLENNAHGNASSSTPMLWGIPLKYISCVVLIDTCYPRCLVDMFFSQADYSGSAKLCVSDCHALFPHFYATNADVLCCNSGAHDRANQGGDLAVCCYESCPAPRDFGA